MRSFRFLQSLMLLAALAALAVQFGKALALPPAAPPASVQKRLALVIGNGAYRSFDALPNAALGERARDLARRIAQSLWYGYQMSQDPDRLAGSAA